MSSFFKKINIENLKRSLGGVFRRMPFPMISSLSIFVILVVLIRVEDMSIILKDSLYKSIFSLVVVFFFSIAVYLFGESRGFTRAKKWIYQSSSVLFGLLFYYFFEENIFTNFQEEVLVYFILTILGVISFVFIASFLDKLLARNLNEEKFYISTYNILIKVFMSVIVGVVTMLLGFIALTAVFALFDMEFVRNDNWYGYWASFSLSLFAPIFFLANLPFQKENENRDITEIRENKFYSFLINYVGLPAIFIYFLILYSYTVKVLMNFSDWPQGEVTWLVILFSFLGYIVYFATYTFEGKFKPAQILRKFLPIAVLLQTFMLFYAIGLRINQYDITINRYLVVVFGIWLFFLSLYFIISRKKSLATPLYSLLIVIIFISIGPWSVYIVPEWRQLNHLGASLKEANILRDNGEIVPLDKYQDISGELSGEIYGSLDYLCNFHGCDSLNKYFSSEIAEIKQKDREKFEENKKKNIEDAETKGLNNESIQNIRKREYSEIRNYTLVTELAQMIKVRRYVSTIEKDNIPAYYAFKNNNTNLFDQSINVSDYDYLVYLSPFKPDMEMILDSFESPVDKNSLDIYSAYINADDKILELYHQDAFLESFDLEETVINSLLSKKDNSLESRLDYRASILLPGDDMVFNLEGDAYELRLVLRDISIRNPEWIDNGDNNTEANDFELDRMLSPKTSNSGYVLIKKKQAD